MATLERREQTPGSVAYRVRWRSAGRQQSKTFRSHSEAKRFQRAIEGELVHGAVVDPRSGQDNVAEFAERWLGSLVDLRPSTHARVTTVIRQHVVPEFGALPLVGITTEHVTAWVVGSRVGASSTRKNLFALRAMLQAAVDEQRLRRNPAMGVRVPAEPRSEQRFLTVTQAMAVADAVHPRMRSLVLVATFGGLRFGELAALRVRDFDTAKGAVRVRETLVDLGGRVQFGPPKTKRSLRSVTLPSSIATQVARHIRTYTDGDSSSLVFTGAKGQALRRGWFRGAHWVPATRQCGLEGVRFHDLRHTFVSLWIAAGRNAKEVSTVAGHSSVAFTLDRYGHLYEQADDDLGDRLDALLRGLVWPGVTYADNVTSLEEARNAQSRRSASWSQQDSNLRHPPCKGMACLCACCAHASAPFGPSQF